MNVTAPVALDTDIPVPATADVTPVFVSVTAPVEALALIPVLPVKLVTPVLVIVTAPVEPLTLVPVPPVTLVTPALVRVSVPPRATGLPPTVIPPPFVTVMDEFWRFAFGIPVGRSAVTRARKAGTVAAPVVGPAKTVFAD